jgi:hypothetical protein
MVKAVGRICDQDIKARHISSGPRLIAVFFDIVNERKAERSQVPLDSAIAKIGVVNFASILLRAHKFQERRDVQVSC